MSSNDQLASLSSAELLAELADREQLGNSQLDSTEGMSPEQIVKAVEEGRLASYLTSKKGA